MRKLSNVPQGPTLPAPIPSAHISPQPAPGLKGPKGLSPKTNTAKVNTMEPPAPNDGAETQKATSPPVGDLMKTANELSIGETPDLQSLVKVARQTTNERLRVTKLAAAVSSEPAEKVASAGLSTEQAIKVAEALDFIAAELEKEAEEIPRTGETATGISASRGGEPISTKDRGSSSQHPPMRPAVQAARPSDAATQMHNTKDETPGGPSKHAARVLQIMSKKAFDGTDAADGQDAKISAGAAAPHSGLDATQSAGSLGGNSGLVSTTRGAIDMTKREAKAPAKAAVGEKLDEKPQSAATDKVLSNAFEHTNQAGTKISSVQDTTRIAATRELLNRLSNGQA